MHIIGVLFLDRLKFNLFARHLALSARYIDTKLNRLRISLVIGCSIIALLTAILLGMSLSYSNTVTMATITYIIFGLAYFVLAIFFAVEGIQVIKRMVGKPQFRTKVKDLLSRF